MFVHKHKCAKCGQPATHQFTRIEKGQVYDLYLCDEHASEMSPYQAQKPKSLGDILEGLLKQQTDADLKPGEQPAPAGLRCDRCHLEFEDYRKNLLLGCSDCYRSFHDQLIPHLRRFHGDTRHFGRKPGGGVARPPIQAPSPAQLAGESAGPLPKIAASKGMPSADKPAVATSQPPQDQGLFQSIEDLTRIMQQAIARQDYAKAAHCRDQLRLLKQSMLKTPPAHE
jgi:protein arginine kinase activator